MKIDTPQEILELAKQDPKALNMHLHFQRFYLANNDKLPSDEQIEAATRYVSKLTSIKFTSVQIEQILGLYPQSRILLAVMGPDEVAVHDALQFAVSHHLLSCRWPTPDDEIDVHDFTSTLRRRAVEMGFKTLQGLSEFEPVAAVEVVESVLDDIPEDELKDEGGLDLRAREFNLVIPPKKPNVINSLVDKVSSTLSSKLAGRFAYRLGSGKTESKPETERQDPSV